MKRNTAIVYILTLILSLVLVCTACGDSKASVMRLMRTQGTVKVQDEDGEGLSPENEMRLYDGYNVTTRRQSYAWINLDNVKLTKMDASSVIEIHKSGKDLEIIVTEGKLYFNIKEPLSDEESLNIRTSTMSVGIRGTCGWVEVTNESHMAVYILEGRVECSVTDSNGGQRKTVAVSGGEMADISSKNGTDISVKQFTKEDVEDFVLEELADDEELREKIRQDSGLDITDFPDSGTPGSPMDQAAGEIDGILEEIGTDESLVGIGLGDETGRFRWEESSDAGSVNSMLSNQEELLNNMLNGGMEDGKISGWMQAMGEAFASDNLGSSLTDGSEAVDYMQIRMASGINCYKPNIYFYGEEGTEFTLSFKAPMLLTRTIPDYSGSWKVKIAGDGKLTVDEKRGYPYLFYESITIPGMFQRSEGFLVKAENREGQFKEILQAYGLNHREIQDFIEFWDVMLEKDVDYLMYPQTEELVDQAMPIEITGDEPENYFRIWFGFLKAEKNCEEPERPEIQPASHEGTAMVEWGGMILP